MGRLGEVLSREPSAESIKQDREQNPDVIAIDEQAAEDVFSSLSSNTARSILSALYEDPRTASELSDAVDTSIQNVNYHLNHLQDGNLIEVAETWYSEQGKEMKVYSPTNNALILFAGDKLRRPSLSEAIKQLLGLVGVFALLSIIVHNLVPVVYQTTEVHLAVGNSPSESPLFTLPPGSLFFLGSIIAIVLFAGWWHYRTILETQVLA